MKNHQIYKKLVSVGLISLFALLTIVGLLGAQAVTADEPGHTIHLRSRTFTPDAGVDPTLVSATANVQVQSSGRVHVLLQFSEHPNRAQRVELEQRGIRLLTYLPDYAWYASVPAEVAAAGAPPQGVHWMGPLLPEDKLDPALQGVARRCAAKARPLRLQ